MEQVEADLLRAAGAGGIQPKGPRDLPDLRLWMLDKWRDLHSVYNVMSAALMSLEGDHSGLAVAEFDKEMLPKASLWWVSADVVGLIQEAAESLPEDFRFDWSFVPERTVFCVLEDHLRGTDAETGKPVNISAFVWGEAVLRNGLPAVGVSMYQRHDDVWVPMGRTDWVVGRSLAEETYESGIPMDPQKAKSMSEDRRFVATLWLLAGQTDVTSGEPTKADRPSQKRSARRGVGSDIRVVDLVRRHRAAGEREESDSGRSVSVRFFVKGHWRNQAWGPGRQLRRPTWINPHIRGPEDAPIKKPGEVVKVLKGPLTPPET